MDQYIRPKSIVKGGKIGIISTARAINKEEITSAIQVIERNGYQVVLGKTIGERYNQFAGNDSLRLSDLQGMIDDLEIEAIICARGGYGTARLLNKIDWTSFQKNPKWIAGYSDVTALHNTISRMGVMSLHGIMSINIEDKISIEALELMLQVLSGQESLEYTFPQHHLNLPGKVEGVLTGGNLSMIYSLRGTPYDVDTERKVLFIEDLDEYLYHIDRMLQNFELSGFFEQVNAVLVGGMTDMNDNTIPYGKTAEEIIHEHVSNYNIPLFYNAPTGHFSNNMPMVCGANATIVEENDMVSLKIHI